MILEILTPEKSIFSGEVYGVQLPGIDGLFEVLQNHAPLVSALGKGAIKIINSDNKSKLTSHGPFDIAGGFVEVLNNKVTVLVENIVFE